MRHFRWILGLLILLAACTSDDAPIPTLRQLSTPIPTYSPQPESRSVFNDLPPTFTPTYTFTPSPTRTGTQPPTPIPTITLIPSATITDTPSPTWTALPSVDPANRPLLALLLTEAARATVLPTDFIVPPHQGFEVTPATQAVDGVPTGIPPLEAITNTPATTVATTTCPNNLAGGFGTVFTNNPTIATQLSCPIGTVQDISAAWQNFQQGIMVWLNGEVLVFYNTGQFETFQDTFVEGVDPQTSSETPPQGLFAPIRGFLKVWSSNPAVRDGLGWAFNQEQGVTAKVQIFGNGRMIWLLGRGDILVLLSNGTWQAITGTF